MTMEEFLYEVDYLVNVVNMPVAQIAVLLGVSEPMVVNSIQILKDAFMETEQ